MNNEFRSLVKVHAVQINAADYNGKTFDSFPFSDNPPWLTRSLADGRLAPTQRGTDYAEWSLPPAADKAGPGDWIVCDAEGQLSICYESDFGRTYAPVDPREVEIETKRGVLVAEMGDDEWEPTQEQMQELNQLFLGADDEAGAVVCVRRGVVVKTLGGSPVASVPVIVAGSGDWEPSAEQMQQIVERTLARQRSLIEKRLRDALSTNFVENCDEVVSAFFGE